MKLWEEKSPNNAEMAWQYKNVLAMQGYVISWSWGNPFHKQIVNPGLPQSQEPYHTSLAPLDVA